jgi:hypothetical protein
MLFRRIVCTGIVVVFAICTLHGQFSISTGIDTARIIELLSQPGVQFSNVQINGDSLAYGEFDGRSELPLTHGLAIGTGHISAGAAPNLAENTGHCYGTLDTIPGFFFAPDATKDVCAITVTAVATSSIIQFRYSFASEEYPEYVDSPYNDVFAIFVSGQNPAGGNYLNRNFAKTPINQNVCVSSVNKSDSRELYYDNAMSGATSIIFDGLTEYLTASISVFAGQPYTITFVIADAADCYFDSGVFIAAFDSELRDLPNFPNTELICFPNPVTSEVRWLSAAGVVIDEVALYDERGRLIVNVQDVANTRSIDMTTFSTGIYMLRIRTRQKNFTFKVVKTD